MLQQLACNHDIAHLRASTEPAGHASEDDACHAVALDQQRGRGRRGYFADVRPHQNHVLPVQRTPMKVPTSDALDLSMLQIGLQCTQLLLHGCDDGYAGAWNHAPIIAERRLANQKMNQQRTNVLNEPFEPDKSAMLLVHFEAMNTPDLFDVPEESLLLRYGNAFESWASEGPSSSALGRDASVATYRVMWTSLTKWALGQSPPVALQDLSRTDLELFLGKRGKRDAQGEDLSPRYVWRLLNLVDRVLSHDAACQGRCANPAARELMQTREEWQHANAANKDPLPECLTAAQAKDLVNFLSAARPRAGRRGADHTWQELRNRAMVAVQLGAGATPQAVRGLQLASVVVQGGPRAGLPWKLVYAGQGGSAGHEGPIAVWAAHILRYWMDSRQTLAIPGDHLFPSTRTGKPIGKVAQYLAVCQTMEASGLDKSLVAGGSFRLRHTFALRQLRRGHTEAEVARWLGVEPAEMVRYRRVVFAPVHDLV